MLTRWRSTWLAGGSAVLLILSLSGVAAAATLVADTNDPSVVPADPPTGTTDTTLTFEDVDANGVDDDCQAAAAVADPLAMAAALAAADLNGDGTISVSEAARTEWTGGPNCNHGGYVSGVAKAQGEACDATTPTTENTGSGEDAAEGDGTSASTGTVPAATCDETTDPATAETTTETTPAVCPAAAPATAPAADAPVDTSPNAHGTAVSKVAQSDAVGGKNCNHGGVVSEVAKQGHGDPHGNAAAKAHGKGHGKGHTAQE